MKLEFPGAVPEIPISDLGAALAYYENNLGFTVDWSDEELGLAGGVNVQSDLGLVWKMEAIRQLVALCP